LGNGKMSGVLLQSIRQHQVLTLETHSQTMIQPAVCPFASLDPQVVAIHSRGMKSVTVSPYLVRRSRVVLGQLD
jgi:hypothetical protein